MAAQLTLEYRMVLPVEFCWAEQCHIGKNMLRTQVREVANGQARRVG